MGPIGPRGIRGPAGPSNFIATYGRNTPDANVAVPFTAAPGAPTFAPIIVGTSASPARFITATAAFTVIQALAPAIDDKQTVEFAIRVTDADGSRVVTRTTLLLDEGETESGALATRVPIAAGEATVELLSRALVSTSDGPPPATGASILPTSGALVVVESLT